MPRIARIAFGAALLACSALSVSTTAFAQDRPAPRAGDHRVRIGDLDLSSANGAARFDERIERQARSACAGRPTLAGLQCRQTLERELRDALPAQQRQDYARGRTGRVLAMVPTLSA
jgi:UrcA family protein